MVKNSQIRKTALNHLENKVFSGSWLLLTLMFVAISAVPALISSIIPYVGSIIAAVLSMVLSLGIAAVCLMMVRSGDKPEIKYLVYGFSKEQFVRSLLIGLLTSLYTMLWSILFVIPGIVKSYAYSAAFYVALDDDSKKMTANQCIAKSQELMKGHKWQLFILDLSFIGWYFIGNVEPEIRHDTIHQT